MRKFFGTDGIRGCANRFPITPDVALALGRAAGTFFKNGSRRHTVVVGKDTRRSGYMIETALSAGLTSAGLDVLGVGPVPTPAVGMLTRSMRADLGIMITASHNHFHDNGIKLFGPDGFKLDDEVELQLETLMVAESFNVAPADSIGQIRHHTDAKGRYIEAVKSSVPRGLSLSGLKLVVDCANGASYRVAPQALWELGAEVVPIGVSPDGLNINRDCGSTHPAAVAAKVVESGAHAGIALDGDGDRLVLVGQHGQVIDGDKVLARIATDMVSQGRLSSKSVVGTIMSNIAFERYLTSLNLSLTRTNVGDRYVVSSMRETGANLGGEPSGHIVMSDFATTGDGLLAAIQVLSASVMNDVGIDEACNLFDPFPQITKSVGYSDGDILQNDVFSSAKARAEARLNGSGRLIVRKSGTEPVIRIMAEGADARLVQEVVDELANSVSR